MTDLDAALEPTTTLDLVYCPECHSVAYVEWRDSVPLTQAGGLVEAGDLVKIRCLQRHWFLMLSDSLVPASPRP